MSFDIISVLHDYFHDSSLGYFSIFVVSLVHLICSRPYNEKPVTCINIDIINS